MIGNDQDQVESNTPPKNFMYWLLVVLRWVVYIPIGILLCALIENVALYLSTQIVVWMIKIDMPFIIMLILFWSGDIFIILGPVVVLSFWSVVAANKYICPSPMVGSIIFGLLYFSDHIPVLIRTFAMDGPRMLVGSVVVLRIAIYITVAAALIASNIKDQE